MALTEECLEGTNSELAAQAVYHEVKQSNDFVGFARQFIFSSEHRVARNALWVLTKASDKELSQLQGMLHELTALAMHTGDSAVRRLSLNIVLRLKMEEDGKALIISPDGLEKMKTLKLSHEKVEDLYRRGYEGAAEIGKFVGR